MMSEWMHEPPTEPGFYWMRENARGAWQAPHVIQYQCDGAWLSCGNKFTEYFKGDGTVQFWPERIEPPKE